MSEELIREIALAIGGPEDDGMDGHYWELDLASARAILPIIRRRELEAGEKVREAAAALMEGKGGVIPLASYYASFVSGNNMPHPSGDNRNRIKHEHQRRAFDRTTEDVVRVLRALDVAAIIGDSHD